MQKEKSQIFEYLREVTDPEIPALDIVAMGIVREVHLFEESPRKIKIDITPTYSGCPAMKVIEDDIKSALKNRGFDQVSIEIVLTPSWTTDWMTEEGKRKLKSSGIAPPKTGAESDLVSISSRNPDSQDKVECPFCDSKNTEKRSEFGSTACKAIYFCKNCLQPFDYFKAF